MDSFNAYTFNIKIIDNREYILILKNITPCVEYIAVKQGNSLHNFIISHLLENNDCKIYALYI